jgi:hypothetical protein
VVAITSNHAGDLGKGENLPVPRFVGVVARMCLWQLVMLSANVKVIVRASNMARGRTMAILQHISAQNSDDFRRQQRLHRLP